MIYSLKSFLHSSSASITSPTIIKPMMRAQQRSFMRSCRQQRQQHSNGFGIGIQPPPPPLPMMMLRKLKPRWVTCVVCAMGLLIVTMSAVSVGAFIGYTYCYMEHRRGYRTGDVTHATNLKVVGLPAQYDGTDKKTINGVLFSSVLVSRLVEIGQTLRDDVSNLHWANLKDSLIMQKNIPAKYI